jgi:hypothetical protein
MRLRQWLTRGCHSASKTAPKKLFHGKSKPRGKFNWVIGPALPVLAAQESLGL